MTRGTDPHIFLVRALLGVKLTEKDITPVLLQHPDGKTALIRGDVQAWAGLDPMMAQAEVEDGAKLFYRNKDANTWGILNVREEFLKDHPDLVKRVLAVYEEARKYSLANYDEVKRVFIAATKLPDAVVDKQLKERTELTHSQDRRAAARVDPRRRPRAAAGRRDQAQRRREGDGRCPDRRPGPADALSAGRLPAALSPKRAPAALHCNVLGAAMSIVQMTSRASGSWRQAAASSRHSAALALDGVLCLAWCCRWRSRCCGNWRCAPGSPAAGWCRRRR